VHKQRVAKRQNPVVDAQAGFPAVQIGFGARTALGVAPLLEREPAGIRQKTYQLAVITGGTGTAPDSSTANPAKTRGDARWPVPLMSEVPAGEGSTTGAAISKRLTRKHRPICAHLRHCSLIAGFSMIVTVLSPHGAA
jgi:hypothetical protein